MKYYVKFNIEENMKFFVVTIKRAILTAVIALPSTYYFLTNTLLGDTVQCNDARMNQFGQHCVFVETQNAIPLRSLVVIGIVILSYLIACVGTVLVKRNKNKKKKN